MADEVILPPPRAVVSAAYLIAHVNPDTGEQTPRLWLEVCPHCTAQTGDDTRMCLCRNPCTYEGCRHDDPMTKLVTGRDSG